MAQEAQQSSAHQPSACNSQAPQTQQQANAQLPGMEPSSYAGKRQTSLQDAAQPSLRKRQKSDAISDSVALAKLGVSNARPGQVLSQHTNASHDQEQAGSEDTRSAGAAGQDNDADTENSGGQGGPLPEMAASELVRKLAANLQMALKTLSILKGADPSVFENLQPIDLARLDLRILCEAPGSTP